MWAPPYADIPLHTRMRESILRAEERDLQRAYHQEADRKRKNQKFGILFSPDQFDEKIGLEQYSSKPLPVEEMQNYGIMASLIR